MPKAAAAAAVGSRQQAAGQQAALASAAAVAADPWPLKILNRGLALSPAAGPGDPFGGLALN